MGEQYDRPISKNNSFHVQYCSYVKFQNLNHLDLDIFEKRKKGFLKKMLSNNG